MPASAYVVMYDGLECVFIAAGVMSEHSEGAQCDAHEFLLKLFDDLTEEAQ